MLEGSVMDAAGFSRCDHRSGVGQRQWPGRQGSRGPRCAQRWRVEGRQVDCRFRGLLVLARRPRNTFLSARNSRHVNCRNSQPNGMSIQAARYTKAAVPPVQIAAITASRRTRFTSAPK